MTQVETTQAVANATPQSPPGLVDVKFKKPSSLQLSIYVPAAVGLYFLLVVICALIGFLNAIVAIVALVAVTALAIFAVVIEADRNRRRALAEAKSLTDKGQVKDALAHIASRVAVDGPNYLIVNRLKSLARHRNSPSAIRLHWTDSVGAIEPLNVNSLAVSLNESDEQFVQLADAMSNHVNDETKEIKGLRATTEETAIDRRIRRGFRLMWMWPAMFFFLLQLIQGAVDSYNQGAVTWRLWLYGAVILLSIPGLAGFTFIAESKEWLIVPGGLLLRKKSRNPTQSDLELFTPKSATLVAVQSRKESWTVFVVEESRNQTLLLTTHETEMALRAWLSPIPPPSVDKLVDLT
jgi:hypothetical protein